MEYLVGHLIKELGVFSIGQCFMHYKNKSDVYDKMIMKNAERREEMRSCDGQRKQNQILE